MKVENQTERYKEDLEFWERECVKRGITFRRRLTATFILVGLAFVFYVISITLNLTSEPEICVADPVTTAAMCHFWIGTAMAVTAIFFLVFCRYGRYNEACDYTWYLLEIGELMEEDVEKVSVNDGYITGYFKREEDGSISRQVFEIPLFVKEIWWEEWKEDILTIKDSGLTLIRRWRK